MTFLLEADRIAKDETLSEKIVDVAEVLQEWKATQPIADGMISLVSEYRGAIDAASTVFGVVGAVWNIYSGLEKAREDEAREKEMVEKLINAMDGMIQRAAADIVQRITEHVDELEVADAITAGNAVQRNFRYNILPYATSFPIEGVDAGVLGNCISDAENASSKLFDLLQVRSSNGDGAAVVRLYRNLIAVVQCKLTMDKWRRGITRTVLQTADAEMIRLVQAWAWVVAGFYATSDRLFSAGLTYFHVGSGRVEFTKYSYYYRGQAQPGSSSNMATVSQAFVKHRQAARRDPNLIPKELFEWQDRTVQIQQEIMQLQKITPL